MDIRNDNFSVTREIQMHFKTRLKEELAKYVTGEITVNFYGDEMVVGIDTDLLKYRKHFKDFTREIVAGVSVKGTMQLVMSLYKKAVLAKFFKEGTCNFIGHMIQ